MSKSIERRAYDTSGHAVAVELKITESTAVSADGDMWSEATAAARNGEHRRALRLFRREAEARLSEGSHGRAAIAYRSAALQVRGGDGTDPRLQDQLWHLAADEYVEAAEHLPAAAAHEALLAATMCYLQVRELAEAVTCLARASRCGCPATSPASS